MFKRKGIICFIIVLSMVFSSVGVVFADETADSAASSQSFVLYHEDNFEAFDEGVTTLAGYSGGTKGNIRKVINERGSKAVYMEINTQSDMHLDKNFTNAIDGCVVVEADVTIGKYAQIEQLFQIRDSSSVDSELCRFIGSTLILYDGTMVSGFVEGKSYRLSIGIDFNNKTYDVYFNNKKRISDHPLQAGSTVQNIAMLRIHMRNPKEFGNMTIDNLRLYASDKPLSDAELELKKNPAAGDDEMSTQVSTMSVEELRACMKNAVGLYVNKPHALVNGVKTYISPDRQTKPVYIGETAMIPVSFFASTLSMSITHNDDSSVTVSRDGLYVTLTPDKQTINANGAEVGVGVCPQYIGGVLYAPVYELCDCLGLYMFLDYSLLIYSPDALNLSWESNLEPLRRITESFIYDDVTGLEVRDAINAKYGANAHPRMLMTEEKFAYIRGEIAKGEAGDPVYRAMFNAVKSQADAMLGTNVNYYDIYDGVRLLNISHSVENIILTCAMAYNLTLDERYAIRARQEMIAACAFKDWHPYHMLDCGVLTSSMGLAYDWMYNYLNEADRTLIRNAIIEKGVAQIQNDYDKLTIRGNDQNNLLTRTWLWNQEDPICNWRFIAGGGVGTGALAVITELTDAKQLAMADRTITQSLIDIRSAISLFAPDGGYEEGMGYWEYSCRYYTQYVSSLETSTGSDYGYYDSPGLGYTNSYLMAMTGPVSTFAYHDANRSTANAAFAPIMVFARKFNRYSEAQQRIADITAGGACTYKDMWSYDPVLLNSGATGDTAYDTMLKTVGVYSARSGFSKDDLWVAMHSDQTYAGPSHDHDDAGTFVMNAMGEEFFFDLGMDNYNLPGYYKLTYRTRAEGHNMLLINPDYQGNPDKYEQFHDVKFGANATIDKYVSKPRGSYAITNLSEVYEADVESAWRGVKLDNYRRTVTVQDEVVMKEPGEIYWFAHTEGKITVADDGKSAVIEKNGKKLLAEIASGEGALFTVMDAVPLPTSPVVEGQNPNAGITKLTVHVENTKELNLAIVFNPMDANYDAQNYSKDFVPLSKWAIEDGEYTELTYAHANDIKVNGNSISGFNPETTYYSVMVPTGDETVPVVTVDADFEYEINQIDTPTGEVTIKLKKKGDIQARTYTILFKTLNLTGIPSGLTQVNPVGVKASAVPQLENSPENTLDGDLETRWSCDGICWIEYDLGAVTELDGIAIAFRWPDQRTAQYSVSISQDGVSYEETFNGDSTYIEAGEGYEYSRLSGKSARYVRLTCRGWNNNEKAWTSILDFAAFKK